MIGGNPHLQGTEVISMINLTDPVTESHIELCYILFFGRYPENVDVVKQHIENVTSVKDLGKYFSSSAEYRSRNGVGTAIRPLEWKGVRTDVIVEDSELARMISHVEADWNILGTAEPHWSVLTHEKYKSESIEKNIDDFYFSGKRTLDYFESAVSRSGIALKNNAVCFELGCGVGRITVWLADKFEKVIAADISSAHLAIASEVFAERKFSNVKPQLLQKVADIDLIEEFDVFISVIVLQHNPPPVIHAILSSVFKRLRPGGVAYFQAPTYSTNSFVAAIYLNKLEDKGKMEVHAIPQRLIFDLAKKHGLNILDIREDGWTGSDRFVSNSILLHKPL